MKDCLKIVSVKALEVLDSRGNPTIQVEVVTDGGFCGKAIVSAFRQMEIRLSHPFTQIIGEKVT